MLDGNGFLQGTAFYDTNTNNKLDVDEAYKSGATIFLDLNFNGSLDSGEPQDITDANGQYFFGDLDYNTTYHIVEVPPSGYTSGGTQILSQFNSASQFSPNTIEVTLVNEDDVYLNYLSLGLVRTIKLDFTNPFTNTTRLVHGSAGQINISLGDELVPPPAAPNQDLSGPFVSFCLDLINELETFGGERFKVDPKSTDNIMNNGGRIAFLYNHFGKQTGLTQSTYAGLQLAFWELVYDAVPDFTTGYVKNVTRDPQFTTVAQFNDVMAAAQNFLNISAGKSEVAMYLDAETANPGIDKGLQGMIATESYNFANIPYTPQLPVPDLSIKITPDATNEVGDSHKFTVTVMQDDGLDADEGGDGVTGFTPAAGQVVDVFLADQLGAGNVELENTCDDGTLADGTCFIEFTSLTAGQVIGNASVTKVFDYGELGQVTLTRDTNPETPDPAGPGGSGPATKTFVDARITITPDATNEVGDPHTFTVTVFENAGDGAGFVAAPGESVTVTLTNTNGASAPVTTFTGTTSATGQFQVTFSSDTAGQVIGNATSSIIVGGLTLTRDTDPATANIGAGPGGSGPATKTYVDARIRILPDATNEVGDPHTFTVLVEEDNGDGIDSDGDGSTFDPAAGESVSVNLTNINGASTAPTSFTGTTDANGEFLVTFSSATAGQVIGNASASIAVGGLTLIRDTDPATAALAGPDGSGPATKTYVDAKILITPDATNAVGDPHTFTVTVLEDAGNGAGFVPAAGESVTVNLANTNGASAPVTTFTGTTNAAGQFQVTFASPTAGQVIGNATASVVVGGLTLVRDTDPTTADIGAGPNGTGPATKTYVDANITITPNATNEVGDPHTFTVTVKENAGDGAGFVAAAGETVTVTLVNQNGASVPTTTFTGTTNAAGQFQVTISSPTAGQVIANATSSILVGGLTLTRDTDPSTVIVAGPGGSGPATKTYVDAKITITPNATNEVGDPHTFTVKVFEDAGDGAGFVAAANETVTVALVNTNGASTPTTTLTGTTNAVGEFLVTFSSATAGQVIGNATSDVSVGGLTLTRDTDPATADIGAGPNGSGPATKAFVDAKILIAPDATNAVGDPHTFTVTVLENAGDGAGFVPAAGESVTVTLANTNGASTPVGTFTGTTNAAGQFQVTFSSPTAGQVIGNATSSILVGGLTLTRDTDPSTVIVAGPGGSGPATKTFVDAKISITPNATNEVGDPHTFTVTVLENAGNGAGFVPAAGESVTVSLANTLGASTPTTSFTGTTNAAGQFLVTFSSATAGQVIGNATANVNVGGLTLIRDTDPATATIGSGPGGTGPATKTFVDAKILITPDATNRVGDPHTFTVTVLENAGNGADFVPAAGESVTVSLANTLGATTPTTSFTGTTNAAGQFQVTFTSATPGQVIGNATSTILVGGLSLVRDTNPATATIGAGPGGTGPATKKFVNAKIAIAADGVNRVGDPHTFTVTVMEDAGIGAGFVAAAGETVTLSEVGVGDITGGTCTTGPTNAAGQCTVIVNSATAGVSTVTASSNVAVGGISVPVVTDGIGLNSAPGKKTWVQPGIDIEKTTNGPSNANPTMPDYDNEDAPNGPGVPILTPGTTVTWTYKVTNTGQLPYQQSEIAIVDDNGTPANTGDDFSIANGRITFLSVQTGDADNILEPGEVWLYRASDTVQALPSGGPTGSPIVFNFEGNSALDGTDGNIRTYTAGGVSVKASAFSRDTAAAGSGTWADAWLGAYGGGLGVTDATEGSGGSDMHTVDNSGQYNFVLLRFDQPIVIDSAFLGYVVGDSDLNLWVGNVANVYTNDALNLSDALLGTFGAPEANLTTSTSTRTANVNSGNLSGNVIVIAAGILDVTDSVIDRFKLETVTIQKTGQGGCYENKAVVTAPGGTDSDLSHYCNPSTPPNPGIDIEKTTNGPSNSNPTAPNYDNEDAANGAGVPILTPGTAVTWTYKVTNTGNVPYTTSQITIVDDNGTPSSTGDDMSIANGKITFQSVQTGDADNILEPGEVWLYKATGVVQTLSTSSGSTITFDMSGSSATSGTAGNLRTFTSGGTSVRASAFSRDTSGNWATGFLGSYSGGLGVTDGSEGTGGNNEHTVDNVGRDNYVLFEFSQNVIVDSAFLGYVVNDSDLRIWIGTKTDPFNNHVTLSDSMLASLGFTEVNLTDLTSTRTADFNSGNRVGNVVVIAAQDDDDTPEDRFKIETLKIKTVVSTCYENKAVVTVPGDDDSDLSHYCNPAAPPPPSTGSLSGHKYRDKTGNGPTTDDKSAPLANVTMYVDYDNDGVLDSNEPRDVTDADGYFQITGLAPATYKVREVVPANFVRTGPTLIDYQTVTVVAGQNTAVNTSGAKNEFYNYQKCDASSITQVTYKLNGTTTVTDLAGNVQQGDQVTVKFYATRSVEASLVSYTAPDSYFDANRAYLQDVFDYATGTFAVGWQTMTIDVPDSYFQVDFVCGAIIDQFGPAGSNVFYTPQGRLIDAHNGGTIAPVANASSLAGFVYSDANNNGIKESGESGIGGVTVKLYNSAGTSVIRTETTRPDGSYIFSNLPAATYQIRETQPGTYNDGIDKIGSQGGTMANDKFTITLGGNVHGTANNFGERAKSYYAGSVVVSASKSASQTAVVQKASTAATRQPRVAAETSSNTTDASASQSNRVRRVAMSGSAVDAVLGEAFDIRGRRR